MKRMILMVFVIAMLFSELAFSQALGINCPIVGSTTVTDPQGNSVTMPAFGPCVSDGSGGGGGLSSFGQFASTAPGGSAGVATVFPGPPTRYHARDCASKYGRYQPNPNFTTQFNQIYGWGMFDSAGKLLEWDATGSNFPPSLVIGGSQWVPLDGITLRTPSYTKNITYLFMAGYYSFENIINTLEHEWAHQNGINDEAAARQAGADAQAAYTADGGAKCAGTLPAN